MRLKPNYMVEDPCSDVQYVSLLSTAAVGGLSSDGDCIVGGGRVSSFPCFVFPTSNPLPSPAVTYSLPVCFLQQGKICQVGVFVVGNMVPEDRLNSTPPCCNGHLNWTPPPSGCYFKRGKNTGNQSMNLACSTYLACRNRQAMMQIPREYVF